jgi:hypothetical protein
MSTMQYISYAKYSCEKKDNDHRGADRRAARKARAVVLLAVETFRYKLFHPLAAKKRQGDGDQFRHARKALWRPRLHARGLAENLRRVERKKGRELFRMGAAPTVTTN